MDRWVHEFDPAPAHLLWLIQRLPASSLTSALVAGGREHFGWTQDTYLLAEQIDMQALGVRVTGNWANKPPVIPAFPRPGHKPKGSATTPKPSGTSKVAALFGRVHGAAQRPQ